MRKLFEIDTGDYPQGGREYVRPSVRGIIIRDGLIAMVHSLKYDYYKFPGGGIESGETVIEALMREVREESGLAVDPASIREYGYVSRRQRWAGSDADVFVQDNFYYVCTPLDEVVPQQLDAYEAAEQFTLEWVKPERAIEANMLPEHGPKDRNMIEREARVLELLIAEGCFL